jgi:hypothetical protein
MLNKIFKDTLLFLILATILAVVTFSVSAASTGKFAAYLSWKAPTKYNDGTALPSSDIAGYEIRLAGKPSNKWTILTTVTRDKLTYDFTTTEIGEHCFQVRAFTADIKGLWSESLCKMITVVPGSPIEFKIIRLEWIAE